MTPSSRRFFHPSLFLARMVVLVSIGFLVAFAGTDSKEEIEDRAADRLRELGGRVFLDSKTKRVTEVNLNRNKKIADDDLAVVSQFSRLTDLSLEETEIGDDGISHLAGMKRLEWINLFRTKITDKALKSLGTVRSLTHLPIGATGVTDRGLVHLAGLGRLQYLGLRGNRITDAAMDDLVKLKALTGLHLGQTGVTDKAVERLARKEILPKLTELWLHDTALTNEGLTSLAKMKTLKRLHIQRTKTTAANVKKLRAALPGCDIYWESDPR